MRNKTNSLGCLVIASCLILLYPDGAWGGHPGPPPDGDIDLLGGSAVNCAGTGWAVPVTKSIVLTALNYEDDIDFDDECDEATDHVTNPAGVKWVVGLTGTYGTFTGGETGTPKTWTARRRKPTASV